MGTAGHPEGSQQSPGAQTQQGSCQPCSVVMQEAGKSQGAWLFRDQPRVLAVCEGPKSLKANREARPTVRARDSPDERHGHRGHGHRAEYLNLTQ